MVAAPRAVRITTALLMIILAVGVIVFVIHLFTADRTPPSPAAIFPHAELRIGIDPSYPPFAVDDGESLHGLDVDLGYALAGELELPVRFVLMGYDGLYDSLRADQVDIVISALIVDPARTQDVRYTPHYFNNGIVLVSHTDNNLVQMEHLSGKRLAFEFGSEADNEARLWLRRVGAFETLSYELPRYALDAVRLGAADAALVDAVTYKLYKREYPDWRTTATYVTDVHFAAALRADRPHAYQLAVRALEALQQRGDLQRIIDRWL